MSGPMSTTCTVGCFSKQTQKGGTLKWDKFRTRAFNNGKISLVCQGAFAKHETDMTKVKGQFCLNYPEQYLNPTRSNSTCKRWMQTQDRNIKKEPLRLMGYTGAAVSNWRNRTVLIHNGFDGKYNGVLLFLLVWMAWTGRTWNILASIPRIFALVNQYITTNQQILVVLLPVPNFIENVKLYQVC